MDESLAQLRCSDDQSVSADITKPAEHNLQATPPVHGVHGMQVQLQYVPIDGIKVKFIDLGKLGAKLVSVDEPMVDDSPMGKLAGTMATAFGEFYSHNLSSRVRYRFQLHRERGRWLHQAPLGYRNVQQPGGVKSLEPDEAAPLVRQAFEMMATGGQSSDAVREFVTAAGLRTKKGLKLNRQTFSFVLKNPVYCALILHKGKTYKGNFPAIVSEALWQDVQGTLRGKKKAVPKKTVDDNFPLRGFVKCGYCQAKLTSGNVKGRSKTYAKYWCWNKQCKHPVSINREKLEADWLDFLTYMQPAFDALVNVLPILANANAHKRIEQAEQRQRHLVTQLSEKEAMRLSIFESFTRGNLTQPEFRRMMDMIGSDIAQIEAARREFVAEAEAALQLTADTSRTTIPAKVLWASARLTDKLTVQNALFPEGICYRSEIGFFEPPTEHLQELVFKMLLSSVGEMHGEEIKRVGASGFEPPTSWSRTSGQNHISRCPGVTYRFSSRSQMDKFGQVSDGIVLDRVEHSELHDGEAGDQSEMPYVYSQHGIANLERRCSDQQIAERNDDPSALLLPVDFACQQRCVFSVGIDFQVV
jgi:hypothetical protein